METKTPRPPIHSSILAGPQVSNEALGSSQVKVPARRQLCVSQGEVGYEELTVPARGRPALIESSAARSPLNFR